MKPLHVLIGCERFGVLRDAFRALGHEAWSCDVVGPDDDAEAFKNQRWPNYHLEGDVRWFLKTAPGGASWDIGIFHPDCTYLTYSGEWAYSDGSYHQKVKPETLVGAARREAREAAVKFVIDLANAPIPHIAIENPRGYLDKAWRPHDQAIQPHQFGDDASKETCLWLKALPPLVPTKQVAPRMVNGKPRWANQTDSGQNRLPPSANRAMLRAKTYPGVASAIAHQWSAAIANACEVAA